MKEGFMKNMADFLLHFDEYGRGIPVMKNKWAEVEKDKNVYFNCSPWGMEGTYRWYVYKSRL